MRTEVNRLAAAIVLAFTSAALHAQPMSLEDVLRLKPSHTSARAAQKAAAEDARLAIVREAAQSVAVRAGYDAKAAEYRETLRQREALLDRLFPFSQLLVDGRLLMPAIEQVDRIGAIEDDGSRLRETTTAFRVLEPARLVSVPPTWRDWLSIGAESQDEEFVVPDFTVMPKTSAEREAWESAARVAYAIGVRQAELVFVTEFESLIQGYLGRVRYQQLLAKNMVTPARLGRDAFGVVLGDNELRINDRLFSVAGDARFTPLHEWKALVREVAESTDIDRSAKPIVRLSQASEE